MLPALRRCPALSAQVTGKLVVDAGAPGAAIPDIVSIEQPKSTSRRRFGLFYEVAEYYYFAEEPYYFAEEPYYFVEEPFVRELRYRTALNYRVLNIAYRV